MLRASTVTLIGEDPNAHGVFDAATETRTTAYCIETHVRQANVAVCQAQGLTCEHVIRLAVASEYTGQRRAVYGGIEYTIAGTYRDGAHEWIDLTLGRGNADA